MKRLLMAICVIVKGGLAYGDWTLLKGSESKGMQAYLDFDTYHLQAISQRYGNCPSYPTVQEVEGKPYFSSRIQKEYDCAEERI